VYKTNKSLYKLYKYAYFLNFHIKKHGHVSARDRTVYLYASRRIASTWDYQISI